MKERISRLLTCSPYRFLIAAAVLAALFCLLPIRVDAPEQGDLGDTGALVAAQPGQEAQRLPAPEPTVGDALAAQTPQPQIPGLPVGADLSERTQAGCLLERTLYYAPCGHSVRRRENLPAQLTGLSRTALEAEIGSVIPGAQVTGFSAQQVQIAVQTDIPCPLHWVLEAGEDGLLCVKQNLTGEALAVVRQTDIRESSLPEEARSQLLDGLLFDDVQTLEGYLESLSS